MLNPWLHSNLFVAGTTVRSDEMNTKLSGIATALQQYADHINNRVMSLPPNFTGNAALPEKTYINSIPYFNLAGDADLYSMAAFDAAVQLAIQKAADAAASQAAALASQNAAAASESQALNHKNAAATSETNAATSATTATTKAGEAATSATNAASSASSANTSATNADNSASAAAGSASAASSSASAAADSASAAADSASAAAGSASAASSSASAASTSATSANNAKTAAEAAASAASSSADDAEYWAGQAQTGGQQVYKGLWNASGNTFPSATTMGWTYKISDASTASLAASNFTDAVARFLNIGDTIIWNAPLSKWDWYADATSGLTPTAGRTDAAAGRVIRAGDAGSPSGDYRFAGLDTATVNTTTSWNSITGVGIYKEPLRGNNTGGPGGTGGYVVQNIQVSTTTLIQFAHPISANSGLSSYVRAQVSNSWGAWRQMLDSENLSQFTQSSVTDATAGKLMKVGAFGLGATANTVNTTNGLAALTVSGFYRVQSADVATVGGPSGASGGTVLHIVFSSINASQLYQSISGTSRRLWIRHNNGGTWTGWVEVWTSENLVKQSSVTDATAGAMMAVGAFGLGSAGTQGIIISNIDDSSLANGMYIVNSATAGAKPAGLTSSMTLFVQRFTAGGISQLVCAVTADRLFSRYWNGTVWSTWKEYWNSGNLTKQSSVTDATAGAMMMVGAFGLGGNTTDVDANTINNTGFYRATSNGPVTGSFHLYHNNRAFSAQASQIAIRDSNDTAIINIYFRNRNSTGTWTAWRELWHGANLVKQTSQNDNTPGSMLVVGAGGLLANAQTWGAANDANAINVTGFFRTNPSMANVPASVLDGSLIANYQRDASNQYQEIFERDSDARHYRRRFDGSWQAWRQVRLTDDSIDATSRTANANTTISRTGKVTYLSAVSDTTNLTITIPTGYSAGDRIELSLSVAAGRVITLSSVTNMAVVNGTAGTSHTIPGATHMHVVMVFDGTNWQLTVS